MNYEELKQYSEAFHSDVATNAHAMDMLRFHAKINSHFAQE